MMSDAAKHRSIMFTVQSESGREMRKSMYRALNQNPGTQLSVQCHKTARNNKPQISKYAIHSQVSNSSLQLTDIHPERTHTEDDDSFRQERRNQGGTQPR